MLNASAPTTVTRARCNMPNYTEILARARSEVLLNLGKIILTPHLFFILIAISQPCTLARSPLLAFIAVERE
jgi:hypothetical protein